jgi:hypothetical protein
MEFAGRDLAVEFPTDSEGGPIHLSIPGAGLLT